MAPRGDAVGEHGDGTVEAVHQAREHDDDDGDQHPSTAEGGQPRHAAGQDESGQREEVGRDPERRERARTGVDDAQPAADQG